MSEEFVIVEKEQLSSMANAVRNSTGSTDRFNAGELSNIVVETLGASHEIVLQNKTVAPSTSTQTVVPDNGYDGLSQVVVNAMPTAAQATPSISVSSSGLITASAAQSAGYVSAGTKSATKQLTVQAAQTITPGTSDKTIASGRYLTGTQTIKGDANLKAANIAKGISIFGVEGSLESGGGVPETCTVTLSSNVTGAGNLAYVTVENDAIALKTYYVPTQFGTMLQMGKSPIECVKGTILVIGSGAVSAYYPSAKGYSFTGGVKELITPGFSLGAYFEVTGDGSVSWNP